MHHVRVVQVAARVAPLVNGDVQLSNEPPNVCVREVVERRAESDIAELKPLKIQPPVGYGRIRVTFLPARQNNVPIEGEEGHTFFVQIERAPVGVNAVGQYGEGVRPYG